jgi:dihydroorotate dehydrogenase
VIYRALRSLLFRMDAEDAHEFVSRQMMALQDIEIVRRTIAAICRPPASARTELFGLNFPSPIGIAAGFDKNAVLIPFLSALGFGFVEVGTVTPRPQPGNPRPRLFRYAKERALINRMGFNNDGADAVAERLRELKERPVLFVNIGKNKDTPLDRAAGDYVTCYDRLAPLADAVVLNLSSPNTPGLRDLQRPDQLEGLLRGLNRRGPVVVKIAPDLDDGQIGEIADVCIKHADGMICTNTTLDRLPAMTEAGGLSGQPLRRKSTDVLRKVRGHVGPGYPLIGVGGVFTAEDVREKLDAGASLVQLYTSFIYEGPMLARRLNRSLGR